MVCISRCVVLWSVSLEVILWSVVILWCVSLDIILCLVVLLWSVSLDVHIMGRCRDVTLITF